MRKGESYTVNWYFSQYTGLAQRENIVRFLSQVKMAFCLYLQNKNKNKKPTEDNRKRAESWLFTGTTRGVERKTEVKRQHPLDYFLFIWFFLLDNTVSFS